MNSTVKLEEMIEKLRSKCDANGSKLEGISFSPYYSNGYGVVDSTEAITRWAVRIRYNDTWYDNIGDTPMDAFIKARDILEG